MKSQPGPPATLGSTAAAGARIVVWCRACGHSVERGPAAMVERYCAETMLLDWGGEAGARSVGSRNVNMVVTGGAWG